MNKYFQLVILAIIFLTSCTEDTGENLPSVEDREDAAINALKNRLRGVANGWRLNYQPREGAGQFLILMEFGENTVRIRSDVTANDGEFQDQLINYRVGSNLGVELIFETYGVFHYLFDALAGEFQFFLVREEEDALILRGKSNSTLVTFEEGSVGDEDLISSEIIPFLSKGIFHQQNLASLRNVGIFNYYIPQNNHTLSLSFDPDIRTITLYGGAVGKGQDEIIANNQIVSSRTSSAFNLRANNILFNNPLTISIAGISYQINDIAISNTAEATVSFCSGVNLPQAVGEVAMSNVSGVIEGAVFQVANAFADFNVYLANPSVIYDRSDSSIFERIEDVFPDVAAFLWYNDILLNNNLTDERFKSCTSPDADSTLLNAVGFATIDPLNNNKVEFFLRAFTYQRKANYLTINFSDLCVPDDATAEEINGLEALTDEIFEGNQIYIIQLPTSNNVFEYYNPCNQYKGFFSLP